ncbi:MAG: ribosomal RNA small subunit methyltransferase A [Candidatus Niyogibacteria bacterium]|nr:ribosomal RNA small subunit methyltransferase A [Candidatus Niyogibacteria bacterium]
MRRLGQHFLTSQSVAKKIADVACIVPHDIILEIGPGKGMLTDAILKHNPKKIIAVEKDKNLARLLRQKYANESRIEIIEGDIRTILHQSSFAKKLGDNYKVVANIPYYLTSFLIRLLLENDLAKPKYIVLMVQKEVAERMIACAPRMNLLALAVQTYGTPKIIFRVSRKYFKPQPKVDSTIIAIDRISEKFFKMINKEKFFLLLRAGFRSKRKLLANNLAHVGTTKGKIRICLHICGIDAHARAENLTLPQWKCLSSLYPHK